MLTEAVGWLSAGILLATIGRQVYAQWRMRGARGVSRWLFLGQCAASLGFIVYSWLVSNWVFVATNVPMPGTALLGQWIDPRDRRLDDGKETAA